jgi:hypothetical protein
VDSCGRPVTKLGSVKKRVLSCVTVIVRREAEAAGRRKTGTCATSVKVVNGGEVHSEEHVSSGKQFCIGEKNITC